MKITLINGWANNKSLSFKSQSIEVDYQHPILCISDISEVDNITRIEVNGVAIDYDKHARELMIDILFDVQGLASIRICCAGVRVRYTFNKLERIKLDNEILNEVSDFYRTLKECINSGSCTIEHLFDDIKVKRINLLSVLEPLSDKDSESIIKDIKKALPYAKGICSSPRLQLKTKYELMDVELAKRITSHSMQHLAAHSEHWKARSITGLIPKRIVARTSEDNLNIYENLFFGKVIDAALQLVVKKQRDTMQALSQSNTLIDWNTYSQEMGDYKKTLLLQKMLPDFDQDNAEKSHLQLLRYLNLLERIERGLTTIISSQFYQSLEKVRVKNFPLPVKPTNILKMDSRYRQILKLWTKLQVHCKQLSSEFGGVPTDPIKSYTSYIELLLIYGLYNEGYIVDQSSAVAIDDDLLSFNTTITSDRIKVNVETRYSKGLPYIHILFEEILFYRIPYDLPYPIDKIKSYFSKFIVQDDDDNCLTLLSLDSIDIIKKYFRSYVANSKNTLDSKTLSKFKYWDKQWQIAVEDALIKVKQPRKFMLGVFPLWGSFSGDDQELEDESNRILQPFLSENIEHLDSMIFVLPFDTHEKTIQKITETRILKRLINYGESYEPDDNHYANYRIGILPVAQRDLSSVQRLVKVVDLHRKRLLIEWGLANEECPVCGSHDVVEEGKDSYKCLNPMCNSVYARPNCKYCGHQFSWIMKPEKNIKKYFSNNKQSVMETILRNESVLGSVMITDFIVESYNDGLDVRFPPRCPHCGKIS